MKISVIIPTYNRADFLVNTIESIKQQTVKVDEIIIIDDGSTDNTKDILKDYSDLIYQYQDNSGVSSARNLGIKLALNEWICFLDSDDLWEKEKIEKQIEFHLQNPNILFSYTDENWVFNGKTIKKKQYQQKNNKVSFRDHLPNTFIGTSTVMIHKSVFDNIGVFDTSLVACEDYDLWLRILRDYEIGFIDHLLIKKIAGHKGQLSFETAIMDQYRIQALLKHLDSKYKSDITKEILNKCDILIKGALKHHNLELETQYRKLKDKLLLGC